MVSIKEIMGSYDDTDSEDDQRSSESEDESNVDMEQDAAEMKNNVELNKTVEDKGRVRGPQFKTM